MEILSNILKLMLSLTLLKFVSCSKEKECAEQIGLECIRTLPYDPVCGCNDKTYSNACHAEWAGIHNYTHGECSL